MNLDRPLRVRPRQGCPRGTLETLLQWGWRWRVTLMLVYIIVAVTIGALHDAGVI